MENEERTTGTRAAMGREDIDALVVRLPENLVLLSGHWSLCGDAYLVFPREGEAICVLPDTQETEASQELWSASCLCYRHGTIDSRDQAEEVAVRLAELQRKNRWKRIGAELSFESFSPPGNAAEPLLPGAGHAKFLAKAFDGASIVDASSMLDRERSAKTAYEVERIRTANEIACLGLEAFSAVVGIGVSAIELAAVVEHAIISKGSGYRKARRVRAYAQVAVGKDETARGWRPFELTTTRRLENGDIALLELATVADGYWSDRTRVRAAGKTGDHLSSAFAAVVAAQDAAFAAVMAGATAREVDAAARVSMKSSGFEKEFLHVTGHGVGFRYHDPGPSISPTSKDILVQGAVITIEPGVYSPAFGGIRIEDNVVVTEGGCEILGAFSRDIE